MQLRLTWRERDYTSFPGTRYSQPFKLQSSVSGAFPSYSDMLLAVLMLTAVKVGKKKQRTRAPDELEERKFRVVCVFFAWTVFHSYPTSP